MQRGTIATPNLGRAGTRPAVHDRAEAEHHWRAIGALFAAELAPTTNA